MRDDLPMQTWKQFFSDSKKFVVVSFFTHDFYTREAFELMRSLQAHKINFHMEQVGCVGDWLKNLNYKAEFIFKMSRMYRDLAVVWLDADSRVRSYPKLFDQALPHIAYHRFREKPVDAVIYLAPGHRRNLLLSEWISLVHQDPTGVKLPPEEGAIGAPAQYYLEEAVRLQGVTWSELPREYCWLWDYSLDRRGKEVNWPWCPVIEQMQANRIGKKLLAYDALIEGEPASE